MTVLASPVSILVALLGLAPATTLFSDGDCPHPGLEISVTVNGRSATPDPLIRNGGQVRVVYRLTNVGDRDLHDVRLSASGGVGGSIACPGGGADVPDLEERGSVVCVAVGDAIAGAHDGTVTATGDTWHDNGQGGGQGRGHGPDHDRDRPVTASAPVGYRGVGGLITATDAVSVTRTATGGRVTFAYSVTNLGDLPVYDFSPSDPLVPAGRIRCVGTSSGLAPGAVARCGATVDLTPGTYRSTLSISAGDRTSTAGADGGTVPPPTLSASASSGFTVVALPPPPPPPPPSPTPTPTPAPPPTPQPTPTPPPTPTPTPTPRPTVVHPPPPRPTPTPKPPPPPPTSAPTGTPVPKPVAPPPHLVRPQRPGIKTSLFVLVMMMPAAGAAAVLAARRK